MAKLQQNHQPAPLNRQKTGSCQQFFTFGKESATHHRIACHAKPPNELGAGTISQTSRQKNDMSTPRLMTQTTSTTYWTAMTTSDIFMLWVWWFCCSSF